MGRLGGKVVLISGAATGIGRRSAVLFAGEGAKVAICDVDEAKGPEAQAEAKAAGAAVGGDAVFLRTDVTDETSVTQAVEACVDQFGKLNVLYNNAGGSTMHDGPVTEAPIEEFWRVINLDLFGTFLLSRYAIPKIIDAGGGSVVGNPAFGVGPSGAGGAGG